MRKIRLLIISLFIFLFGISSVNAMTLKPTGSSNGKRGDEITLYITLNRSDSEKTVSAVDGTFSYDSNVLELVSYSNMMSGWIEFSKVSNNNSFSYGNLTFDNLITSNSQNIVKVILKIKDDASYGNTVVSVTSPSATDDSADGVTITGGSHTVKVLSDVNTLTNITVNDASIGFNENTLEYDIEIDGESASIVANKKDDASTISGDIGNKDLNYGVNTFKITVTSESGNVRVYKVNINRTDNRSKVNTLDSLELSEGKINFDKNTLTYNLTVENKVSSIKVDAKLTDELSSYVTGYGPRTLVLTEGTNSILIKVKAENESVKTYTINVTRKSDSTKNDNNYLSELVIGNLEFEFDKEILEYRVAVLYEVDKVAVSVKTEHNKATYEIINPSELLVGENEIKVVVTAESGITREYKIIVLRKDKSEELSSNSKLSSLNIQGYNLDFDSDSYEYYLNINDEDSLIITYELDDENSSLKMDGNNDLENGSVVTLTVTAEDGSKSVYTINIQKEESSNMLLLIIIGALVLIVIVVIIIVLVIKNKNNGNKNRINNSTDNTNNVQNTVNQPNMMYAPPIKDIQSVVYTQKPTDVQNNAINNNQNNGQNNNFF